MESGSKSNAKSQGVVVIENKIHKSMPLKLLCNRKT